MVTTPESKFETLIPEIILRDKWKNKFYSLWMGRLEYTARMSEFRKWDARGRYTTDTYIKGIAKVKTH
jgi:hypothetical protein